MSRRSTVDLSRSPTGRPRPIGSNGSSGTFMSRNFIGGSVGGDRVQAPRLASRQEFEQIERENYNLVKDDKPWVGRHVSVGKETKLGPVRNSQVKDTSWKDSNNFYGATPNKRPPIFGDLYSRSPRNPPLSIMSPNTSVTRKTYSGPRGHSGRGLAALGASRAIRTSGDSTLSSSRPEGDCSTSASRSGGGDCNSNNSEESKDAAPAIREESGEQTQLPHLIGFQNMGNSCYVAATMQTLLGLPTLLTEAVNILGAVKRKRESMDREITGVGLSSEPVPLVSPFVGLYQALQAGKVGRANRKLRELKEEMGRLDRQFQGDKMQDANEFLGRFIDELKESLDRTCKSEEHDEPNLVANNFKYNTEETLVCCECGASDTSRHADVNFFLDLSKAEAGETEASHAVSLQSLVTASLAEEMRERRCEECGGEQATACSRLISLPRVLLICLKRYDYVEGEAEGGQAGRKVNRPVDIPETISLSDLVSEGVSLPIPSPTLATRTAFSPTGRAVDTPTTPTSRSSATPSGRITATPKSLSFATPLTTERVAASHPALSTPAKFKGKTDVEMSKMTEEDQLEYLLFRSQQEAELNTSDMTEEQQLQAALKASLQETPEPVASSKERTGGGVFTKSSPTSRKRTPSFGDGSPSQPEVKKTRRELFEATLNFNDKDTPRSTTFSEMTNPVNETMEGAKETSTSCPRNEDEDLKRALENSLLDLQGDQQGDLLDLLDQTEGSSEKNNNMCEDNSLQPNLAGPPSHHFRLASVVSHFGAGTSSGHYVADVVRFDAGSEWFRYDDTVVTPTDQARVRCGRNRINGYIFLYLHQPVFEQCSVELNSDNL